MKVLIWAIPTQTEVVNAVACNATHYVWPRIDHLGVVTVCVRISDGDNIDRMRHIWVAKAPLVKPRTSRQNPCSQDVIFYDPHREVVSGIQDQPQTTL